MLEERGGDNYFVLAPFPLSTWHHPSPAPAGSRTSARPGQAGRQPGPGKASGHLMGDLLGRLALLGALLLSGERGPWGLADGLALLLGGSGAPL